jgi:branched-chain amino acid transport system ATP-binding protein
MLTIDRIHTYYGDSHVLQGVSLQVEPEEVVVLLGRNGAGKSTLINSIIGFVRPRQGRISLGKTDIAGLPSHQIARLGVGLVPQGRAIFPTLTVRENVTLAARNGRQDGWHLDRVVETFPPLAARLQNLGAQLSGGEQQMLAIARALMTNPHLLLLDEPSEGLAPMIVTEIKGIINQLRTEGLSILLVEQNLALALEVADRAYLMSKGRIVFEGAPSSLSQQPELMQRYLGV